MLARVFTSLFVPILGLSLTGLSLTACSVPDAPAAASSMTLTAAGLYNRLMALPRKGPGSLSDTIVGVSRMSFSAYFAAQYAAAPDSSLVIDGYVLANPRATLRKNQTLFDNAASLYPTVGAWWEAVGFVPSLFSTETAYATALSSTLSRKGDLGLVSPCGAAHAAATLSQMDLSWFGGEAAAESELASQRSQASGLRPQPWTGTVLPSQIPAFPSLAGTSGHTSALPNSHAVSSSTLPVSSNAAYPESDDEDNSQPSRRTVRSYLMKLQAPTGPAEAWANQLLPSTAANCPEETLEATLAKDLDP